MRCPDCGGIYRDNPTNLENTFRYGDLSKIITTLPNSPLRKLNDLAIARRIIPGLPTRNAREFFNLYGILDQRVRRIRGVKAQRTSRGRAKARQYQIYRRILFYQCMRGLAMTQLSSSKMELGFLPRRRPQTTIDKQCDDYTCMARAMINIVDMIDPPSFSERTKKQLLEEVGGEGRTWHTGGYASLNLLQKYLSSYEKREHGSNLFKFLEDLYLNDGTGLVSLPSEDPQINLGHRVVVYVPGGRPRILQLHCIDSFYESIIPIGIWPPSLRARKASQSEHYLTRVLTPGTQYTSIIDPRFHYSPKISLPE